MGVCFGVDINKVLLTHFLARSESNAPSQAKEGGKTLSRRPGVKDNDWLIFLEYDALCIFCIPYPNQESLTNSPEVFPLRAFSPFSSRVFSQFACFLAVRVRQT